MMKSPLQSMRTREVRCSGDFLKWMGFVCVCMGTASTAIFQNGILAQSGEALYDLLEPGKGMMGVASCAVALMLLSALAIPLYAKLLYEGWKHTSSVKNYFLRLGGIALLSEFAYDWAMRGKWLDMSVQNPVWSLLLALVMLEIFQRYGEGRSLGRILLKGAVLLAACLWAVLIQSYMGVLTILLVALFYFLRDHKKAMLWSGLALSLMQFPAPFGMLFVYWYDGKRGRAPRNLFYLLYPMQLVVFGILGRLIGG